MCGKPQMELENPILPETQQHRKEKIAVPIFVEEREYVSAVEEASKMGLLMEYFCVLHLYYYLHIRRLFFG